MKTNLIFTALLSGASVMAAGCAGIGPPSIARDRFDYVASISESWKRQMLQNLLKVRYTDAPVFLDVTSVISGYAITSGLNVGGQYTPVGRSGDTFGSFGGSVGYADHPTITYAPLSGDKFARGFLAPLSVSAVLYLLQSGYPADVVLRICTSEINGLDNAYGGPGNPRAGDPRFAELLAAMREAQSAGILGMRIKSVKDQQELALYFRAPGAATTAPMRKIQELLGLNPQAREYNVVYGSFPANDTEIAILSRSALQVLTDFASYIDVPASEVAEGSVYAPPRSAEQERMFPRLLHVRSGDVAPANAHVSVRYRDQWFWIDDRDVQSKALFNFLMLLFSLTETGTPQAGAPVVTVPAR